MEKLLIFMFSSNVEFVQAEAGLDITQTLSECSSSFPISVSMKPFVISESEGITIYMSSFIPFS